MCGLVRNLVQRKLDVILVRKTTAQKSKHVFVFKVLPTLNMLIVTHSFKRKVRQSHYLWTLKWYKNLELFQLDCAWLGAIMAEWDMLLGANYRKWDTFILLSPFISDLAKNYWFEILMLLFLFSTINNFELTLLSPSISYLKRTKYWSQMIFWRKWRIPLIRCNVCLSYIHHPMLVKVKV